MLLSSAEAEVFSVAEILQPHDAGYLEADGLEQTFKFSQNQRAAFNWPAAFNK